MRSAHTTQLLSEIKSHQTHVPSLSLSIKCHVVSKESRAVLSAPPAQTASPLLSHTAEENHRFKYIKKKKKKNTFTANTQSKHRASERMSLFFLVNNRRTAGCISS